MSKIFCVISNGSLGGTFLDWSVHWLSGEDEFYNIKSGWNKLTDNPLTPINAHNHQRNYVSGYSEVVSSIDKLKSIETDDTLSIYGDAIDIQCVIKLLEISKDTTSNFTSVINEYIADDFKKVWEYCNLTHTPVIHLKLSYPLIYTSEIRSLEKKLFPDQPYNTVDEVRNNFLNLFFEDSSRWTSASPWDKREWLALNIRPFSQSQYDKNADFSIPHLYLDAQDWWFNGEASIQKIMNYLDITIDPGRWTSWIPVYQQWQKIQIKLLRFAWNIDYICDAIVNNHYYDLSDYNLDLWHEAIIQHCLLYRYNLNLKSWQLEKFPANTQDLHKLLESNTLHKLDDIYGLLKDKQ